MHLHSSCAITISRCGDRENWRVTAGFSFCSSMSTSPGLLPLLRAGGGDDVTSQQLVIDTLQSRIRTLTDSVHELKSALVDKDLEVLEVKDRHAADIARFRGEVRKLSAVAAATPPRWACAAVPEAAFENR